MHLSRFPLYRPRRMRYSQFSRDLLRENTLTVKDLIYPVFLMEGRKKKEAISAMPNIFRLSMDNLFFTAEECLKIGIPAMILFPVILDHNKTAMAELAYAEDGLIANALRELKQSFPELGLIADVALDPYTDHGQDGLINAQGEILNDETVEVLVRQALCYAEAGADIVAPSDMMDGRVLAIRKVLEASENLSTKILAYSAKYASAFYSPFREAVGSAKSLGKSSKVSYQLDPANACEALRETALDIAEGSDIVMVKPGMPYLDILWRIKKEFSMPTFVYQVSGEYTMLKLAAQAGHIDERPCVLETLIAFKRAGADAILTYYAMDVAYWLKEGY